MTVQLTEVLDSYNIHRQVVSYLQEAKASLEAAVPGLLQKDDACRLSHMMGIIMHN